MALLTIFFLSGFAALLYQVVWQRVLFSVYGIDHTSVAVIVTVFMLGLGIGSLVGGALSERHRRRALPFFAVIELGIGLFGFFSLPIFAFVTGQTLDLSRFATGLVAFLLLLVPTTLMGATLPLLVAHATARSHNVGRSVGVLYFANTLGAAIGAFAAGLFLLGLLGLAGTVRGAAVLNILLALGVLGIWLRERPQ
ncbi:MAG: fused MFS/spermidine synthase [Planctomycetota bacterium]